MVDNSIRAQQYRQDLSNPNVQRALASIRAAENTASYSNPYGTAFGGTQFSDYSQHPGIVGSFRDSSGRTRKTTAAGAYQMLGGTWKGISNKLGLTDFSPENQDIAAVGLIDQRGALDDVKAGNVPGFASKVRDEWASFPNSPYGQPTKSLAQIQNAWNSYNPDMQNSYVDPQVTTAYQRITPVTRAPLMAPVDPLNVPGINATPTINEQMQAAPRTAASVQVSQPSTQGGLLSPQEAQAVAAQRNYLSSQPFNTNTSAANSQKMQKALGAVLGGLLGGVTLGPVGGLLGAVVGRQVAAPNGLLGNNSFPDKPQSTPRGDGSMTNYGRSVAASSGQFSNAMSKGGIGLY